jgi:hypothetical protein
MYSQIPKLPNEIVDSILEILKIEEEFNTLTLVARASHNMYDIAIPRIYETVVVNEKNRSTVGYGHGIGDPVSKQGKSMIGEY